jgi:hypothetical protein
VDSHTHVCFFSSQLFVRPSKSYFDMSSLSLVLCVWVFILTDKFLTHPVRFVSPTL